MNRGRGSNPGDVGNVARQLLLCCVLMVFAGCGSDEPSAPSGQSAQSVDAIPAEQAENIAKKSAVMVAGSEDVPMLEQWSQSCALCHVDGNGGAPRIGNASEWAPRLAKGADVLLRHTLEGYSQMPPLGYCMSCERDDFVAMIDFMTQNMTAESDVTASAQQPGGTP